MGWSMEMSNVPFKLISKVCISSALVVLVTACASSNNIIIDTKGVNMSVYQQDLAECRSYAEGVRTDEKVTKGAATGAVVGGLVGAVLDGGEGAARGAGVGVVTGGARGVSEGDREKEQVVKRCLSGRGYRVLN
jgi:outer membrane lipoprotein SlyB